MQNYNAKLKIICLFLLLPFLTGCAGKISNNSPAINNRNTSVPEVSQNNRKLIKVLFVGDMMFDRYIREGAGKYGHGDYDYILSQVKDKLAGYDLVVGNLEGPITDKSSVSVGTALDEKKNLDFSFDPAVAKVLAVNNIKLVDLGNNHILNQGEDGVVQTKKYLDVAGVQYFGDLGDMEIESPYGDSISKVVNISGTKIGFVNYNYSVAGSFERAIADIKNIRAQSDVVAVCPHWGTEYKIGDPGQEIRSEAYKLIDAGADLIVGGHPHVVQDSETYKGKKIYYSLGNFIFDQYFSPDTMQGLGVELTVAPDLSMGYNELKVEMTKKGQTEIK
ncbi:MAG: CapA family protein [Candidatus Moranbacteria bacterium]|nr:CapA family protein [Candidatus Moranbacteria bacterium]